MSLFHKMFQRTHMHIHIHRKRSGETQMMASVPLQSQKCSEHQMIMKAHKFKTEHKYIKKD